MAEGVDGMINEFDLLLELLSHTENDRMEWSRSPGTPAHYVYQAKMQEVGHREHVFTLSYDGSAIVLRVVAERCYEIDSRLLSPAEVPLLIQLFQTVRNRADEVDDAIAETLALLSQLETVEG